MQPSLKGKSILGIALLKKNGEILFSRTPFPLIIHHYLTLFLFQGKLLGHGIDYLGDLSRFLFTLLSENVELC